MHMHVFAQSTLNINNIYVPVIHSSSSSVIVLDIHVTPIYHYILGLQVPNTEIGIINGNILLTYLCIDKTYKQQ